MPTSEKPQDKYNWLGTTGITTNLTSGSIVQDGATYVPQIGAPLQTEGIPLPPEPKTAAPYALTVAPIYVARNETWAEAYEHETPAGNIPELEEEGEEWEQEEIDPTTAGKYGHLNIDVVNVTCDEEGYRGEFKFKGVTTGRGKLNPEMQMTIAASGPGWSDPSYLDEPPVYGTSTPSYEDTIFIPYDVSYTFELHVSVGKHKEKLGYRF